MNRLKKILYKILFPHIAIIIVLVPVSTAFLIYTLAFGSQSNATAYISYFLSAYTLTVVCGRMPGLIKDANQIKERNKYINRYLSDVRFRIKVSLYLSLGINILYSIMQLGLGFYYHSIWFYSLFGYYVLLAVIRFFLLQNSLKTELGTERFKELLLYRFCGMILLLVNLALAVIVTYIVWQNRGFEHSEILTIAMAAYTFYTLITSIIDVIKYRRYESPIMSAAKAINVAAAFMSLLSLETSMISAFGSENGPEFRQIMTASTGAAVCLIVLLMAIYMIVSSTKEIKKIKGVKTDE